MDSNNAFCLLVFTDNSLDFGQYTTTYIVMVPKDTKKTNIDVKRAHISEILHNYPLDEVASIFSSILSVTHLLCSKNTFFFFS